MAKEVMSQELVKCPCCEKMVPATDVELTYRLPDDIASMDEEERDSTCKYTNDYVVCNDEYFYLRCVLPLPIHDTSREYCLGVWVQVSPNSFNKVWELWDDDAQVSEPPFRGLLANNIHLNTGASNAEVMVQLTGPKTRPVVTVKDVACSLYKEQQCGITIHRSSEYSDLCR
jgi:hypothetical protein